MNGDGGSINFFIFMTTYCPQLRHLADSRSEEGSGGLPRHVRTTIHEIKGCN